MRRKKNHTHQICIKMTKSEYEKVQRTNEKLFGGEMNNSDLGRFLLEQGLDKLAGAKVETRKVVTVDGVPVGEVK